MNLESLLQDALAELDGHGAAPIRFQVICPHCAQPVWTSAEQIGQQVNCLNCDGALTVQTPESLRAPGAGLTLVQAGSQRHPSLYSLVEPLNLSTASSLEEMFMAFHAGDGEAEALRQLRDPTRRFGHDLLCYPYWHNGDTPNGPQ